MKIENIIEDIKRDIVELGHQLEEQFRIENPALIFSVSLPGLEELTTSKTIALTFVEGNATFYLSVHILTHNGNRVFENEPKKIINNQPVSCCSSHPLQARFIHLLRHIIKRNKNRKRLADMA